jgi:hypothetical protein
VQQESSEQVADALPNQPTEATTYRAAHRAPAGARVPTNEKTVALPAFITGKKPGRPGSTPEPVPPDGTLPASERGMLIFVAALLGVGTIAVIAFLGLGGFSAPPAKPAPPPAAATSVSPASPASPESPVSPSPTDSLPPPSPSPTVKRSTAPTHTALGTLNSFDPRAFCIASSAGRARQHEDHSWYCTGGDNRPESPFSATDVCRWRYLDKTAYAVVADIDQPATWKCYT